LTTSPEIYADSGKGKTNFNTHIAELGLSYILVKNLIFHADYRFDTTDYIHQILNWAMRKPRLANGLPMSLKRLDSK
jgi:hypothetical protein